MATRFKGDPALFRHVKDVIVEAGGAYMSEGAVFEELCARLPEYRRKKRNIVEKFIKTILRELHDTGVISGTTSAASKRDHSNSEDDGTIDSDVDVEDIASASKSTAHHVPEYNMLNASLYPAARAAGAPAAGAAGGGAGAASGPPTPTPGQRGKRRRTGTADGSTPGAPPKLPSKSVPTTRLADVGGLESCLMDIMQIMDYPLTHPEVFSYLGVQPPRGVLLYGPPGCGKSLLAQAIAGELGVHFQQMSAPEMVSGVSGESEEKLRALFDEAIALAPSIIFIDEIDSIVPKRDSGQRMEKRMVAQLKTLFDDLKIERTGKPVMVIGAATDPDSLDPGLRRAGRFDREICLGIPDEAGRRRILEVLARGMKLAPDADLGRLGHLTPGFVGADLAALTKEAASMAINRVFDKLLADGDADVPTDAPLASSDRFIGAYAKFTAMTTKLRSMETLTEEQLASVCITQADFEAALRRVQPAATREGFGTIPSETWEDVGALTGVRAELETNVVFPICHPEKYAAAGIKVPAGVLLFGPPGCGKTLLAKAVANATRANFISVKGPELLDKYVGESEKSVRQTFARARASAPCIVFFDEMDALAPRRGSGGGSGGVSERVVNQLLTELDGLNERGDVFVIAATNRPDIIDPAMLRPGRLDKLLYVPLPTPEERVAILGTLTRGKTLGADVDLEALAKDSRCDCFSGADLAGLVREAVMMSIREEFTGATTSCRAELRHFDAAFLKVRPSVSKADQKIYSKMATKLQVLRGHLAEGATTGDEGAVTPAPTAGAAAGQ